MCQIYNVKRINTISFIQKHREESNNTADVKKLVTRSYNKSLNLFWYYINIV